MQPLKKGISKNKDVISRVFKYHWIDTRTSKLIVRWSNLNKEKYTDALWSDLHQSLFWKLLEEQDLPENLKSNKT